MTVVNANLVVPIGLEGSFRAEAAGEVWSGPSSRSARTKLVRALRERFGRSLQVNWSLVLPPSVAADLAAYKCLAESSKARDRRDLGNERVAVARQLLACRLSVAEAAYALGITPAWLGRQLGQVEGP